MVHVGVGTQNADRSESRSTQRSFQLLLFLRQAGVQQNTAPAVQFVKRDQLVGLNHPGITFYTFDFHPDSSLIYRASSFFMPSSRPSTVRGNMGNSWAMAS